MLGILKILRRAYQNNCLDIVHTVITQLTQDYMGTSNEDPLRVLTSSTYRGASRDSQGTNTKIYGLLFIDKIVFQKQQSLYYMFISVFYRKNKYSNVLNRDVRETSTRSSFVTSRGPNNGTFQGLPRDAGQNIF